MFQKLIADINRILKDPHGDMTEKALVMVLVALAAMGAWALLGERISAIVQSVAAAI